MNVQSNSNFGSMLDIDIEISDIKKITALIKGKYKYDFSNYAMSSFKRRIKRVLEVFNLPNVSTLLSKLEQDPRFFKDFLSEITVNVTEMFRDPSFWRELRDKIIPNILLNHEKIHIWHAGCSSGEEVYSMCILLKEMDIVNKAKIVATDIDHEILAKAKEGTYPLKNMELNNRNYVRFLETSEPMSKYYTTKADKAIMDPSLVEQVSFRIHDLVNGEVFNKFDLILCRNVMIYFNQSLQNIVLKKFHESLFKYSYLAIGAKESLIWCEIANKFIVANNEEKIYKKIRD